MNSDPWPIWGIIIDLLIIIVNGYFAASRRAISSVSKGDLRELEEEGNSRAAAALKIVENPKEYKLAIKSLNIILYMLFSLVSMVSFIPPLISFFMMMGIQSQRCSFTLSVIVILLIFATLLLALGEMLPRKIAVQHDTAIVMSSKGIVSALTALFKPMMGCIYAISFIFLKLFRQRTDVNENEYDEDNIVDMLEAGQVSGELKEEGKNMITGVFAFDDILAHEIMTPRTDVFAIDIKDPAEEYIDELMELRYSRIPVYEDDSDNIIGILNIKDYLIKARQEGFDNVDINSILRKPYFVPETKNIDSLFVELQKTKQQIAILIDEYGGFCGIVTMEDIIEEVMGDIDDEYDEDEQEILPIADNLYLIDGGMNINDLNKELRINLVSEDSETIGGFIIDMFGEIPTAEDTGREIPYENFIFTIKSVKDRRLEEVMLKILPIDDSKE